LLKPKVCEAVAPGTAAWMAASDGRLVESKIVLPSGEAAEAPEIDENAREPL